MATCGRLCLLDQSMRLFPLIVGQRSLSYASTFKAYDMQYRYTNYPRPKPIHPETCKFGKHFTDHMLIVEWEKNRGWGRPLIKPLENISLHPATAVFHYATELFEGMKAYRTPENKIAFFRPMMNMDRMLRGTYRACLPAFDKEEFLKCLCDLVRVEQEWVPYSDTASLYLRPTFIGTEPTLGVNVSSSALLYCILSPVGPYFSGGQFKPVSLMADPRYVRASAGGFGAYKLGSNYGPTIRIQEEAHNRGCEQVLWLYGPDHQITEVGTMNMFIYWINEDGDKELATMPLDCGIVLPGVTRQSLMELAAASGECKVTERVVTMGLLRKAIAEGRLLEMFGAGTACVVCPVERIRYLDEDLEVPTWEDGLAARLFNQLTDIHYGRTPHEWSYIAVDDCGEVAHNVDGGA